MSAELWLAVPGMAGKYEASSLGRVRHARSGRIVGTPDKDGYIAMSAVFGKKTRGYRAHQLVAAAFLGPCPDGHEVDHRNRLRTDNRPENLRYITIPENRGGHRGGRPGDIKRFKKAADADGAFRRKVCRGCRAPGHNARTCADMSDADLNRRVAGARRALRAVLDMFPVPAVRR